MIDGHEPDSQYLSSNPGAVRVKPPQSRRGRGWSVVYRKPAAPGGRATYIKRQSGYMTRVWWRAFRLTPRLVCEHRALQVCAATGIPAPAIVSFREEPDICELVVEDVGPAQEFDAFIRGCESEGRCDRVICRAAAVIAKLHASHWVHGALGNDHLLVRGDDSVVLIDFEKARLSPFGAARDLERFWRRTGCLDDRQAILFREAYRQARRSGA